MKITKRVYIPFFRDETLEALGDANTVAPATRTADLHSQSHRNSYLYVFDYQTKFGDYPQVCYLRIYSLSHKLGIKKKLETSRTKSRTPLKSKK